MSDIINSKEPGMAAHSGKIAAESQRRGTTLDILCVGRDAARLEVAGTLEKSLPRVRVRKRVINNGHADPLYGMDQIPDLVVYFQSSQWKRELEEYTQRPLELRPPLVVVGDADHPDALRTAMKASARDFLSETADGEEMVQALGAILREILSNKKETQGNLVSVINAKGGSGASLLASNIAYMAAVALQQKTVFVDLDVQFGSAGQYLDATPRCGLLEALQMADNMDEMALDGYVVKHKSGLHVLSAENRELYMAEELAGACLSRLLELLSHSYEQVIVDTPRHIDPFTSCLLERADKVAVVVQQYITNLRDATRLLHILTGELGVEHSRISVVVNRYQANAEISLKDIENTLGWPSVIPVPNDFRAVNESINRSQALYELSRNKPITRAIQALSEGLTGVQSTQTPGMLTRIRSWF